MKLNKKIRIAIQILCVLVSIASLLSIKYFNIASQTKPILQIGDYALPTQSINGLLMTFAFLICVASTFLNPPFSGYVSLTIIALYIVASIINMLKTHSLAPLPVVGSGTMTIFFILIINEYIKSSKRNAVTDITTGLTNIRGFFEQVDSRISGKKSFKMIYIQFKNIREINDEYGHEVGDIVLKKIGERILEAVGKKGKVSRIGGTEFVILLDDISALDSLVELMKKHIGDEINVIYGDRNLHFYAEGNAGIASYPEDAKDRATLIKCADVALIHAEEKGNGTVVKFDSDMENELARRHQVEAAIKEAVAKNYFYLLYQPQFNSNSKKLRGFEALVRMKLPNGEQMYPGEFIPIAEKSGLISSIDKYVMNLATKEFAETIRLSKDKISLSVNVSAKSVCQKDFAAKVLEILSTNNFPSECLEIEITEYSLAESKEQTIKNLEELSKHGITVALDDFGTGYTSLSQVLTLPVDLLKVDKSLIDDIEKSDMNRDFLSIIAYMGHVTNCEVIAEGVETENQLKIVKNLECDYVQGYVWSKPLDFDKAVELIVK